MTLSHIAGPAYIRISNSNSSAQGNSYFSDTVETKAGTPLKVQGLGFKV